MRRVMTIVGCYLALAAPTAGADGGGPFTAYQGPYGASAPGVKSVYTALQVRRGRTLVEHFYRPSGGVLGWRVVRGNYGVPAAAGDGSTTGLSADGHRLVLAEITGDIPPKRTRLLLFTGGLHLIKRITLPGAYTVDAISPDGRWLYLIHYTTPRNLLRYEVLAYDLPAGRLDPKPVIDPREPDEDMRGTAVTRVMSADGRWAYTLYTRPKGAPFVHALDTERRTAVCIDLDDVSPEDLLTLGLSRDGGTLIVRSLNLTRNGEPTRATEVGPVALIDTRTFAVSRPGAKAPRRAAPPARGGSGPWGWLAGGLIAAGAAAALVARRRRVPA